MTDSNPPPWPGDVPAVVFRIVRPTDKFDKIVEFYRSGLGLDIISSFRDHDGYNGVMLGLPAYPYHLEIIERQGGDANINSNKDNLLVFYFEDHSAITRIESQLNAMGYPTLPAKNPWWNDHDAVYIEDADQWGIVLYPL
ncbi:MAG: VOC family protein [Xanthomonadaceae bacterium]|nr:VOC family protein [Xanthomonadaceae bacterium]